MTNPSNKLIINNKDAKAIEALFSAGMLDSMEA